MSPKVKVAVARMTDDERELWEERAGIMEYDGGLPRDQAEEAALEDLARVRREALARRRGR